MSEMTEQSAAPAEIGIAEAAKQMLALEEPRRGKPRADADDAAPAEAVEETAEATGDDVDETAAEEEQGDGEELSASEDDATDSSADDDDNTEDADDADQMVTVKIDGKAVQIPLKEAVEGYQRQADYSRRMNQLKEQRQQFDQEVSAVRSERQVYSQLLGSLQAQLRTEMSQEPNWAELYATDKAEFAAQRELWRDRQERFAAAQAEQVRLYETAQLQERKHLETIVTHGRDYLLKVKPEWKDTKRWESDRKALRDYGQKIGFSDEELSQAYDPRAIVVLEKAMRYDRLMSNRPKPQAQAEGPKQIRSSGMSPAPKGTADVKRMKARLAQSGSVDDAAALFGLLSR